MSQKETKKVCDNSLKQHSPQGEVRGGAQFFQLWKENPLIIRKGQENCSCIALYSA